jgi:PncC family amidohydrolase
MNTDKIIDNAKIRAYKAGYNLLKKLFNIKKETGIFHKIATGESITGGLIFSMLVDIPFAGAHKYGSFIVYDIDAKRQFLNIDVNNDNVYSHNCVKQMAEGVLNNSNASIAIVVSGNARPNQNNKDNIKKLGEVFIGVAGYKNNKTIISETKVFNFCNKNKYCDFWINEALKINNYNSIDLTSFISNYIRIKTVEMSLIMALNFINKNKLVSLL